MEQLKTVWRKSSYSGNGGSANCVETASVGGTVAVRDTADRQAGTLLFSAETWTEFAESLK